MSKNLKPSLVHLAAHESGLVPASRVASRTWNRAQLRHAFVSVLLSTAHGALSPQRALPVNVKPRLYGNPNGCSLASSLEEMGL